MTAAIPHNRPSATTSSSTSRTTASRWSSADGAAVHVARLIHGARQNLQVQFVAYPRRRLLKVADEGVHDGDLTFPFGPPIVRHGPTAGHMMAAARAASATAAPFLLVTAGFVRVEHGC